MNRVFVEFSLSDIKDMVLAPCKKAVKEKIVIWLMESHILAIFNGLYCITLKNGLSIVWLSYIKCGYS